MNVDFSRNGRRVAFAAALSVSAVALLVYSVDQAHAQATCELATGTPNPVATNNADFACGDNAQATGNGVDGATAVGSDATATGGGATALGDDVTATGDGAVALGGDDPEDGPTNANGVNATAVGAGANATGTNATVLGNAAEATAADATAIGQGSSVNAQAGVAVGQGSQVNGAFGIAVGEDANAEERGAIAIGGDTANGGLNTGTSARGISAIAIGDEAEANGNGAIAIGGDPNGTTLGAFTNGNHAIAIGDESAAVNGRSVAVGAGAIANPNVNGDPALDLFRATAVGSEAQALNHRATAVGSQAIAGGRRSTALGTEAVARGGGSVAIGDRAQTGVPGEGARNAVSVGRNTNAQATGSVAIGTDSADNGAVATQVNEFALGTRNHTYTAAGITSAESRNRQTGPLEVVTTDANGHLASDGGQIFGQIGENSAGVAIAIAMENPDLVGNEVFGLSGNIGFFDGNTALAFSAMGVLGHNFMGGNERWALSGGVGVSLNENDFGGQDTGRTVAGRAGLQVSW